MEVCKNFDAIKWLTAFFIDSLKTYNKLKRIFAIIIAIIFLIFSIYFSTSILFWLHFEMIMIAENMNEKTIYIYLEMLAFIFTFYVWLFITNFKCSCSIFWMFTAQVQDSNWVKMQTQTPYSIRLNHELLSICEDIVMFVYIYICIWN